MQKPVIAVINDDNVFLELMTDIFVGEGYEVVIGLLAANAHALIARTRPNIVLLDVRMETPDAGLALLYVLHADSETTAIPVLLCSADARFLQQHQAEVRALGAATLAKPFDLNDLLVTVAELIEARKCSGVGSEQ